MKLSEILLLESNNNKVIHLLKDGLFWRAYNVSAFLFVSHIKKYQLTKKFYKNVNAEVVHLGFPDTVLPDLLKGLTQADIQRDEKHIIIKKYSCEKSQYDDWKASIQLKIGKAASSPSNNNVGILQRIASFDTLNKTPFECQQFLVKLQTELKDVTIQ